MSIARITEVLEDYSTTQVHKGRMLGYQLVETLNANSVIRLVMVMPATKVEFIPILTRCDRDANLRVYAGTEYTEGTGTDLKSSISNHNGIKSRTTKVLDFRLNPTVTVDGTVFSRDVLFASQFVSGGSRAGPHWILVPSTTYMFEIENKTAQAGTVSSRINWIEE